MDLMKRVEKIIVGVSCCLGVSLYGVDSASTMIDNEVACPTLQVLK